MLFLKAKDGTVHIHRIETDGTVGEKIAQRDWSSGWTTGLFYQENGNPYMFFLKSWPPLPYGDPTAAARVQVLPDGTVGATLDRYQWTAGWTTAVVYRVAARPYVFLLKKDEGTARVRRIGPSL